MAREIGAQTGQARLKIRRQPILFPIAITGWLKAAAAIGFFRQVGVLPLAFGAACRGLGQGPFRGGRQRVLGSILFAVGWHCP